MPLEWKKIQPLTNIYPAIFWVWTEKLCVPLRYPPARPCRRNPEAFRTAGIKQFWTQREQHHPHRQFPGQLHVGTHRPLPPIRL